jgi:NADP-dependent 3-hydroxy acid dehydrogenase YdfG
MSFGPKAAERLAGKTVFLTGASSGIGKQTAIQLAEAANGNIRLILAARRVDRLEELKATLHEKFKDNKIKVLPLQLDVSNVQSIPKAVEDLPNEWYNVDILINNASVICSLFCVYHLTKLYV